jgi:hypothetical protein
MQGACMPPCLESKANPYNGTRGYPRDPIIYKSTMATMHRKYHVWPGNIKLYMVPALRIKLITQHFFLLSSYCNECKPWNCQVLEPIHFVEIRSAESPGAYLLMTPATARDLRRVSAVYLSETLRKTTKSWKSTVLQSAIKALAIAHYANWSAEQSRVRPVLSVILWPSLWQRRRSLRFETLLMDFL